METLVDIDKKIRNLDYNIESIQEDYLSTYRRLIDPTTSSTYRQIWRSKMIRGQ